MPKPLRYLFIVLALFGLAFAIWTGIPRRPHATDGGAAPQAVVPEDSKEPSKVPEVAETSSERVETTSDAPEANVPAAAPTPERKKVLFAQLTVRFVDAVGNPVPDVHLSNLGRDEVFATSDAAGRVALDVPQLWSETSWSAELIARRKGYATKQLECQLALNETTPLGDVRLEPGVDVYGRTVDEAGTGVVVTVGKDAKKFDGTDAARRLNSEQRNLGSRPIAHSDSKGDFVLEGLPLGETYLWAKGEATRMVWSEKLTLVEGVDLHGVVLTVPLPREDELISGVVLLPDGRPAAGAFVSCAYVGGGGNGSNGLWAGTDGRFRILFEPGFATYDLTATDLDGRYGSVTQRAVKPGTHVELRLLEQGTFTIALRGPGGEPIDECSISMQQEMGPNSWGVLGNRSKPLGDGRHELVAPKARMLLQVAAAGCRTYKSAELDPPVPGSTLEIQLERLVLLRGRVLAEGKPAAGATVSSFKVLGDSVLHVSGFRSLHQPFPEATVTSQDDGTFELPYEGEDPLWIRVELAGFAAAELEPTVPANSSALTIEIVRGGILEGVVILPNGADAEGTVVGISRCDGFPRTQRAAAGGRFRFENLTPGPWQVLRRERDFDPTSMSTSTSRGPGTPIEWSCEVSDGRTTRFDLDLSRP